MRPLQDTPTVEQRPPSNARLYRRLLLIRRVEEEIARLYPTDVIKSPIHLSIGQESVSVGVCEALDARDVVFGTYRCHALYLAKGGDLRAMLAELYGKQAGCGRGKAGSMHLVDVAAGMLGASAVVGTTIPHAVGYALASKLRGTGQVVASFFGEGAMEEGVFYESLGFAAERRLPVLFVCENNRYAIHADVMRRMTGDPCGRVEGFGVVTERVADGDVRNIYAAAARAVDTIRAGEGPRFLECLTYRLKEHVGPGEDWHLGYRSEEEARPWRDADPVRRLPESLPPDERRSIEAAVESELAAAIAFAEASPFPEPSELLAHLHPGE